MNTTPTHTTRSRLLQRLALATAGIGLLATSLTLTDTTAHAEIQQGGTGEPVEVCGYPWFGTPLDGCLVASYDVYDVTSGATVENGGKVRPGDILETSWTLTNNTTHTFTPGQLGFESVPEYYTCGQDACEYGPEVPDAGTYRLHGLVPFSLRLDTDYYIYPGIGATPSGDRLWLSADALPTLEPGNDVTVYVRHQVPLNAAHGVRAPRGGGLRFTDPPNVAGGSGNVRPIVDANAYVDAIAPVVTIPETPIYPDHTFTGTAEPDAAITLTLALATTAARAGDVCTAVADGTGAWECTPTTPLPVGTHTLTVTSVSAADGYTSTSTADVTVVAAAAADLHTTVHLTTINGAATVPGQTVTAGDELGYTITTSNTGTAEGTTTLTATLPTGTTSIGPAGGWTCTDLTTCTTTVTAAAGDHARTPLTLTLGTDATGTADLTVTTSDGVCDTCNTTTPVTPDDGPGTGNPDPGAGAGAGQDSSAGTGTPAESLATTGNDAPLALIATALGVFAAGTWLLLHRRTTRRVARPS